MESCPYCETGTLRYSSAIKGSSCDFCGLVFKEEPFNWKILAVKIVEKHDEWLKNKQAIFIFHLSPMVYNALKNKAELEKLQKELPNDFHPILVSEPFGLYSPS